MRLHQLQIALTILAASVMVTGVHAQVINEWSQTMKTYPFSDPSPLPAMAISSKVAPFYPYSMIDGYTDKGSNQQWKVVTLENKYITVAVLPEVGGKVLGAIERSTGKEFVYWNHVMKFRAIGIRGPWTSGGIEHNFGLDLGHAPWAAGPVDYALITNPDSSVTCVVGGLDLASRSEWRVKINLPKNKAYFETEALWFNPLPLHQAYLSWENAAFRASNDLQFYFPGNYHIGHDGLASPWPIDSEGRDLSQYKNNNFGDSKSYHVVGDYRNWFGGYWKNADFGFGHWSDYSDAPGKKIWIWSLAREGAIWEDLLTDHDGQYIEAQSGVKLNQAAERSGYHSPFRQLSHKPFYGETKTDYWFPVVQTGGMVDANPFGSLNTVVTKDSVYITISPLQTINDSLIVKVNGRPVFADKVDLTPMQTFTKSLKATVLNNDIAVNVGNKKLYYSGKHESIIALPVRTPANVQDMYSGERLFRMAEEQNAMRNFNDALELYKQCIEKEPTHSEALARIAELYYRSGDYEKGLGYARSVLTFSAYDGAANLIYGALQQKLGHYDEAEAAYSTASRTMEFRSAAFSLMAEIEMNRHNYELAEKYASKSLDFNKYNLTAACYQISANRKLGQEIVAAKNAKKLLEIDPLNHYARFEQYLTTDQNEQNGSAFREGIKNEFPHETYLELAIQYHRIGMDEEAVKVLRLAPAHPVVYYWMAYLLKTSSVNDSKDFLVKAEAISARLIFPFRPETLTVLEWAQQQAPSWKNIYYCGLIQWNNNNLLKAKELFKQCSEQPDYAPFYISRGILFSDDPDSKEMVLNDLSKAIKIEPGEWRSWSTLNNYFESNGSFAQQFENAAKAYGQFSANPIISVDYARALLNVKKPGKAIEILNKTLILPQEGAKEGHELFEMAHIALALEFINNKKYKEAAKSLGKAKLFPEALGEGKPYEPDYRLIDDLLAYCARQRGDEKTATQYENNIIDYSSDPQKFNAPRNATSNYIGAAVLRKYGKGKTADSLIGGWKFFQDSLSQWNISKIPVPMPMQWVLSKYSDPSSDQTALESKIAGSGKESQFSLFLRAMHVMKNEQK
jgi:tetratricopeptide (TPR) repeat protein